MKRYLVEFTVRGVGSFPLDMLRYDDCFPNTSYDAASMGITHPSEITKPRDITLCRYMDCKTSRPAAKDRWRSFGWTVTNFRITHL